MKKIIFVFIALLSFATGANAQKKAVVGYNYELGLSRENIAATAGFKIFKVWSYGKKKELLTQDICMRNAIHGLLLRTMP